MNADPDPQPCRIAKVPPNPYLSVQAVGLSIKLLGKVHRHSTLTGGQARTSRREKIKVN